MGRFSDPRCHLDGDRFVDSASCDARRKESMGDDADDGTEEVAVVSESLGRVFQGTRRKSEPWRVALTMVLMVVMIYALFAWMVFTVRHPMAGDGAFFVYFPEWLTFKDVQELQGGKP